MKRLLTSDPVALRRAAEALWRERPALGRATSDAEVRRLRHELEVHQIELEMQNEDLRNAHAAAEASLDRYVDLFDFAPVGYFTIQPDSTVSLVNLTGARFVGLERERLLGRRLGLQVAETDRRVFNAFVDRAFATGEKETCEIELAPTNAPRRNVSLEATRSEDGKECRALMTDITARVEAARSLRLFQTLFQNAGWGMAIFSPKTDVLTHVNPAFARMHGFDVDELPGKRMADLIAPESPARIPEVGGVVPDPGHHTFESIHLRKDGTRFPCETGVTAFTDESGAVAFLAATFEDVTRRNESDQAKRVSEERFRELAATVEEVFWMSDPKQKHILYVSPAYERIWGRSCASLIESPAAWKDSIHPGDAAHVLDAVACKQASGDYDETYRIIRPDGSVRWIHDRAFPILDANDEVVRIVGAAQDITEQREQAEQFRQAQKMDAIGQLAGGIAHDFNNILAAIMMRADTVCVGDGASADVRDAFAEILAASKRAADLTSQLLLFSRRQVMQQHRLDVNSCVTNLAKMLHRIIGEDVGLELHLHPTPLIADADAGMLDQVIVNLAVNARDAMPDGGSLSIVTSLFEMDSNDSRLGFGVKPGRFVCIRVEDTGTGIDPEIVANIFEPFFTTKEPGKGTGLGLAIVFGIVKQHGGWINVNNNPGRGVAFQIFFPAAAASEVGETPTASPSRPAGGAETILLVEDEEKVRALTRKILVRSGYTVLEAANGNEALDLWREHRASIAMLFTDIVMPGGLSGLELACHLRGEAPELKIIYTSGYSSTIAGKELHMGHGESFIKKPCMPDEILNTVRRNLDA